MTICNDDSVPKHTSSFTANIHALEDQAQLWQAMQISIMRAAIHELKSSNKALSFFLKLPADQQSFLFDEMPQEITSLVKSSKDYNKLTKVLGSSQRVLAFEQLKPFISTSYKSLSCFSQIVEHLSPSQQDWVFKQHKTNFQRMVSYATSINEALIHIHDELTKEIFDTIAEQFFTRIKGGLSLGWFLRDLSVSQCQILARLIAQSKTENNYFDGELFFHPSVAQCQVIISELKELMLEKLKQKKASLSTFLNHVSGKATPSLFDALKDDAESIVHDSKDLSAWLHAFNGKHFRQSARLLKNKAPTLLHDAGVQGVLYRDLAMDKFLVLIDEWGDIQSRLIKDPNHFEEVMKYLSSDKKSALKLNLKNTLLELAKTPGNDQIVLLFNCLKEGVFDLFTDENELATLINALPIAQLIGLLEHAVDIKQGSYKRVAKVFNALKLETMGAQQEQLSQMAKTYLKTSTYFCLSFQFIESDAKKRLLFGFVEDKLDGMLKKASDFGRILAYLPHELRDVLFDKYRTRLKAQTQSAHDFRFAIAYLSPQNALAYIMDCNDKLDAFFTCREDIEFTLRPLKSPLLEIVCIRLAPKCEELIKTQEDVNFICKGLDPKEKETVSKAFDNWPRITACHHTRLSQSPQALFSHKVSREDQPKEQTNSPTAYRAC